MSMRPVLRPLQLDLLNRRKDLPPALADDARMRVLENYAQALRYAHEKREARRVDEEITLARQQQPRCNDCTISVAALARARP